MTAAEAPVLTARALTREYGGVRVLENVDLDAHEGRVLGLIGPNGGGKSTLLLHMAGLVRPSAGEIRICGVPAHDLARTHSGRVGLITAQPGLYPLLTGRENLRFFGALYGLDAADVDGKAEPFLRELGLGEAVARRVGAYSSGMRQKLSLVRAMLLAPRVLLLDEPTANLDAVSAFTLHQAVRRRADEGVAVVLATHDLQAAEGLCDEVILLDRRVVARVSIETPRLAPRPGRLLAMLQELEADR